MPNLDQCLFYHTLDLPGLGTVKGYWDLRGKEQQYLGGVALSGKRVLEIGPASGGLTFYMERAGAEVVSVEAPADYRPEYSWDVPYCRSPELAAKISAAQAGLGCLHNSYWLAHRLLGSKAKVHYGSAYDIPAELGAFDVATVACVLLHNKNPLGILEAVARATRETIVVVEILPADPGEHPIFLRDDTKPFDGWFHLPPAFVARVLKTMGYPNSTVTYHTQMMDGQPVGLYTVVASRD